MLQYNALVFCIVIFCVVFIIIYFAPSLSSIFSNAVFYAICKVSLFHILTLQLLLLCPVKPVKILILQLFLLCPVKPANIRHFEQRTPPSSVIFQDTSIWWKIVNSGHFYLVCRCWLSVSLHYWILLKFLSQHDYILLFIFENFSQKD